MQELYGDWWSAEYFANFLTHPDNYCPANKVKGKEKFLREPFQ